ncbi:MAG TPA: family 43 glycosylhydrolase [Bacillaceae bacterium]|nr:family 43 glycosylhydrolase [Paenibacillus bovis]HLU24008.1 family 43 glycosylhydrolase [Bacillaceae bacterium]
MSRSKWMILACSVAIVFVVMIMVIWGESMLKKTDLIDKDNEKQVVNVNPNTSEDDKGKAEKEAVELPPVPDGMQRTAYQNPILKRDAPDPSGIVKDKDGYYYMITTQSRYYSSLKKLPILRSQNLVDWEYAGEVLPEIPNWLHTDELNVWAPDFVEHNGKYYVYYSGKSRPNDRNEDFGIGVAVADHPLGPYVDKGEPIVIGPSFATIDPFIFKDDDGTRYMYWGSAEEPILVQKLSEDGMSLEGEPVEVLEVERYKPYERLLEAPWVVKRNDAYYLFVSGDNCCGAHANYAVIVAKSDSPLGPFKKYWEIDEDYTPLLEENEDFNAPGHNSIITDESGQEWILYHAFDRNNPHLGRTLMIDKVEWVDGWPVVNKGNGPTANLQQDGPITKLPKSTAE